MSAAGEPRGLRERVEAIIGDGIVTDARAEEAVDEILALLVGDEEPVAYRVHNSPKGHWVYHENQYKPGEMARILHDITPEGSEIIPLFTRPAPTPEVERLREALERIASMGEYGCYSHTGGEWAHSDDCTVGIARRALNEGRQADTDTTEGE